LGSDKENWVAPTGKKIPDFIICGAMKSGTSTLHYILNQHPQVFIPKREVNFFDIDNLFQHPDFCFFDGEKWVTQNIEADPEKFWQWYSSRFEDAEEGQIIGEDSTTYIASARVARRIRIQEKEIKVIVLLRHPTDRAYSQYWHMVRTGRALFSFENTIRYDPFSVLYRSHYLNQLKRFMEFIPREQMEVVVFEEFLKNKNHVLQEVCGFIGVDGKIIPEEKINSHVNKAQIPKYPSLQLLKTRLFREKGNQHYIDSLPMKPPPSLQRKYTLTTLVSRIHRMINPLMSQKPPKMKESTRRFLDGYFKRELAGLDELTGQDILSRWF